MLHPKRTNSFTLELDNRFNSRVFANDQIHVEASALQEIASFQECEGIISLDFTPDVHRGNGNPIGTVALIDRIYPRVTGTDLGCGMSLYVLEGISELEVSDDLKNKLRHAFFEGGRQIFVDNRADLLAYGLEYAGQIRGELSEFLPKHYLAHSSGVLGAGQVSEILKAYTSISSPRDNFLGTLSGGNHFVEIQRVDQIVDRHAAYALGLRSGALCVMVHNGSLDLGQQVGNYFKDQAKRACVDAHPSNGYFSLPSSMLDAYMNASNNAANFAAVNRALLAAMVAKALQCSLKCVYDAPHNLIWQTEGGFLHRKGACPATKGETVIVPGSMGTRSFVGTGGGFEGTHSSAPHGAGRTLNRQGSRNNVDDVRKLEVVAPIDFSKVRSDIADEILLGIAEEAPKSYKSIEQVIETVTASGMASTVVWNKPILTLKR